MEDTRWQRHDYTCFCTGKPIKFVAGERCPHADVARRKRDELIEWQRRRDARKK